jgi:hypothetical protein
MTTKCWFWPRSKDKKGYGRAWNGKNVIFAHHFMWELSHGEVLPKGQNVLHACDNPACVNPDHLFLGTHAQNMADKAAKGRSNLGERHPLATLTEKEVREIRELARQGMPQREVALKFEIRQNTVSRIVNRVRWKHVI